MQHQINKCPSTTHCVKRSVSFTNRSHLKLFSVAWRYSILLIWKHLPKEYNSYPISVTSYELLYDYVNFRKKNVVNIFIDLCCHIKDDQKYDGVCLGLFNPSSYDWLQKCTYQLCKMLATLQKLRVSFFKHLNNISLVHLPNTTHVHHQFFWEQYRGKL